MYLIYLKALQQSSSAIRLRILPKAITYLTNIGADILAEHIPRISIPNIKQRFNNGLGNILLSAIRVSRFKRASYHTISTSSPNIITWIMKNLSVGLIGDLSGEINVLLPMKLGGEIEVSADGIHFKLETTLERSKAGAAQVSPISCRTMISVMMIEIHNGGIAGMAFNLFKKGISRHIRPLIQTLICEKVIQFINEDINAKLSQTQTKTLLANAAPVSTLALLLGFPSSDELIDSFRVFNITSSYPFLRKLASRVYVDFSLSEDPVCYNNTIEIYNMAEISITGSNTSKAPFSVPPMSWKKQPSENAMIHLLISDYIANALLYHAFMEHLLQFVVDDQTVSSLHSLLRTSCSDGICLADLIPQLTERYPNSKVRLIFKPTRAPVLLFQSEQGGILRAKVEGLVFLHTVGFEDNVSHQAATFVLDIVADMNIFIENHRLLGKITLSTFRMQHVQGNIEISDEELSDIELLCSEVLQRSLNDFLQTGFLMPIPKILRIKETELHILNRSIFISTEFGLDRRRVSVIASEAIADSTYFPRKLRVHSTRPKEVDE
ncbi:unnamed protein product [Thelazia callipaeda]|uniref:BPI2 domain-containing protein n=1 Tax=Thelazia callipaeda TaxID=103827 RepID=A0A0N5CV80_THECL|nr:unnamed protein product [Thelazia callipaeda]